MQTILDFIIQNWIFLSILVGSLLAIISLYFVFNMKSGDRFRNIATPKESQPSQHALPLVEKEEVEPVLPIVRDGEIVTHPVTETPVEEIAVEEAPVRVMPEPIQATSSDAETVSLETPLPKPKKTLGRYHVLYRSSDNSWIVKREGSDRILRVLETQKDAIAFANIKALSNDTQIVIHKKDGKIRKQNYRKGDED